MGGHISVGVRRKDGSFKTIGVWTNPLKWYLTDPRFLDGSVEPLDEFFARYLKEGVEFGGPQANVPGEYGFVLVDEIDRLVMNWNHYTRMNAFRLDQFGIELGEDGFSLDFLLDDDFIEARRQLMPYVSGASVYDRETKAFKEYAASRPLTNDDDLAEFLRTLPIPTKERKANLELDLWAARLKISSPHWTFLELDHFDSDAFPVARSHVESRVALSPEEIAEWDEEGRHRMKATG